MALILILSGCSSRQSDGREYLAYIDPMIGTAPSTTPSAVKHSEAASELNAQVFPAVGFPFGMTNWTPQTRDTEKKCVAPYYYRDTNFQGFRASHWMSGSCTQDYGSMTVMAITGELKTSPQEWATPFSHEDEVSGPAYYSVKLNEYGIKAEMSGSSRAGLFQFTFEKADTAWLLFMPNSDERQGSVFIDTESGTINIENPAHRIYQGWGESAGFSGHFYIKTDQRFKEYGIWQDSLRFAGLEEIKGGQAGVWLKMPVEAGQVVKVRIGSSFTDSPHAKLNLETEIPHWDMDRVVEEAEKAWGKVLGKLRISKGTEAQKLKFYTALYHTSFLPRVFSDVDGSYPAFADSTGSVQTKSNYYADFSMWDTYRAIHPLFTLIHPARTQDMMNSLVLKAKQGDWLPIFPAWNSYTAAMIGDHVSVTLADAYVKGVWKDGAEEAFGYMKKNATELPESFEEYKDGKGRRALESYLKYGFIPLEDSVWESFHRREQVSRTLEYAFDDFALAQMARKLGKKNDAENFMLRAMNYQHVFDTAVGFVRGKHADGSWVNEFDAKVKPAWITEGTPWHYSWYVPHDPYGLIALMGGPDNTIAKLDTLFESDLYWHGNEPGHQIPYMYVFAGAAWKTQQRVHEICQTEYDLGPGGLTGNDDAGQMSAWYVFSSLGFYPVCPGSPFYLIGSPAFEAVELHLENGQSFTITTENFDENHPYIQSASMDGKPFERSWLSHAEIMDGGRLVFVMGPSPNPEWGTKGGPPDLMVFE